jgi:hypothetical protein
LKNQFRRFWQFGNYGNSQAPHRRLRLPPRGRVRYDGGHKRNGTLIDALGPGFEFVPVCPEVEVGMGTPRGLEVPGLFASALIASLASLPVIDEKHLEDSCARAEFISAVTEYRRLKRERRE